MSDKSKTSVMLVGIGGYGETYLRALTGGAGMERCAIVSAVDPAPERCSLLAKLRESGVPVFSDMLEALEKTGPELTVISSPIHLHCPQSVLALERGSNVLCEKPVCAVVQDARAMSAAARNAGRFAAVGYQWSFSSVVQAFKRDVMDGLFGRPIRLKTMMLSPRNAGYYSRNNWAGAARAANGAWVLDSPANNAHAHYLHNMFYALGAGRETSLMPSRVRAELYRANRIGNFDTAAARIMSETGVEILFYTSHAVEKGEPITFNYLFEKAEVEFAPGPPAAFEARFRDGALKRYVFDPGDETRKLWDCVGSVRSGAPPACGVDAALAHTLCVNGMHESAPRPADFPAAMIRETGAGSDRVVYAGGLADTLKECYLRGILPSEFHAPWAVCGEEIDMRGYDRFPRSGSVA